MVGRLHSPQGQSSLKASQQVEGAAAPDVRLWEGEEYGISGIPCPPLNIITLCGWYQNTWAAPTFGGLRWVFWAVLVGPQRRQMDKLGLILSFGSSEGPCLQCPLISCRAAHCWSMTAPQLSVLWAWARTLIHRGGPLKIHPVKVIMPEPWSRDRGPDQWGGGAARRGFQGDAATTDSDPPSAVEKPGESSQVKSQRQPLTEALKKSK